MGQSLTRRLTRSCGCRRGEANKKRLTTHGMRHTPEYKAWCDAISRCENPKDPRFEAYGSRGIYVCEEWRNSFQAFYEGVGNRPSKSHSIERVDNDKGYEPGNCRWATHREQSRNTTRTRLLSAGGQTQCLKDWADELGCAPHTITSRLERGWSVSEAVTAPPLKRNWRRV